MAIIANDISKDIGAAFSRLFNQQTEINAESKYMLYEFETKRGDREVSKLKEGFEMIHNVNNEIFPDIIELAAGNLENLNKKVQETIEKATEIVTAKETFELDISEDKKKLEEDWDKFQAWLIGEREKVDSKFVGQMSELRDSFSDIDGISSPSKQTQDEK